VSSLRRWPGGFTSQEIADHARASTACPTYGAGPGSACTPPPEPPRTVCRARFVAAAIELKNQRRAAAPSPEDREACARLDLATERGTFMADIAAADVAARLAEAS
jgi:hypothetical protein